MDKKGGTTYEILARARKAFNEYFDANVKPLLGLSEREMERLNFVQVAERIEDSGIRGEYRDRAIKLLEANISFNEPSATPISSQEPNGAFAVASTLFVSALGYRFGSGVFSALLAAAVWYWFVAEYTWRKRQGSQQAAKEHNDQVAEWTKTIQDWKADLLNLELLE
ncbi:hypothetical protein [Paraburkholderia sp. GAS32]|uniref:hypothetical protein n=1 Tax=Paraburkholderia sp. GAS32 TaxID=3035129 RepID=UPI003D22EF0D